MKRCLFFVVTLILLGAPAGLFAQTDAASGETEVRDALQKYSAALMKHDAATLKQFWADDYVFINAAGEILTKDRRVANLDSGATALPDIDLGKDIKVHVYGDAAVATAQVTIKGQYSGKAASGDYQSMTVWVKRGEAWQLVANQLTRIAGKE